MQPAMSTEEPAAPEVAHVEGTELPDEDIVVPPPPPSRSALARIAYVIVGLALFVTALGLMKKGSQALIPSLEGSVFTDNSLSTLGLGWLGACLVLSGSPVAASALTLLDGGAIDRSESFTMLVGSRLGAAFVVVVVGVIYAIRGRRTSASSRAPISIGILALLTTAVLYIPGAIAGYLLLERGTLDSFNIGTSPEIASATDTLFGWVADLIVEVAPGWTLFPVGLMFLLGGFQLFDRALPVLSGRLEEGGAKAAWHERKWPMFLVGCGVTMLTLSVSVSLTLLVPLVARGYLRRKNLVPYIAGANITTLADTLVAAILLGNQDAVRVVVAITLTVTVWTLFLLAFFYPLLRRASLGVTNRVLRSKTGMATFAGVLFLVPIALIII